MSAEVVYFLQSEQGGKIKIGRSSQFRERFRSIQNMCPVKLRCLGVMPGGRDEEDQIQARFASLRLHGEWFEPGEALVDFVRRKAWQDISLGWLSTCFDETMRDVKEKAKPGEQQCVECKSVAPPGEKYCWECSTCQSCGMCLYEGETTFCEDCISSEFEEEEMIS